MKEFNDHYLNNYYNDYNDYMITMINYNVELNKLVNERKK